MADSYSKMDYFICSFKGFSFIVNLVANPSFDLVKTIYLDLASLFLILFSVVHAEMELFICCDLNVCGVETSVLLQHL